MNITSVRNFLFHVKLLIQKLQHDLSFSLKNKMKEFSVILIFIIYIYIYIEK